MKKIVTMAAAALLWSGALAQQPAGALPAVVRGELTPDDFTHMFQALGVQAYRFDMSRFAERGYAVSLFVDRVDSTGRERIMTFPMGSMLYDLNRIPEADRAQFRQEYGLDDTVMEVTGTESLTLIVRHGKNDSTALLTVAGDGKMGSMMRFSGCSLPIRSCGTADGKPLYYYDLRPFTTGGEMPAEAETAEVPLLYFGSYWYDARFDIYRSCGVREIDPSMMDTIVEKSPHKLIVGVLLTPPEK